MSVGQVSDAPRKSGASRGLRKVLFQLHTWVGLTVSVYMTFLFLTGTLVVFGDEIGSIFKPQMRGAPTATPASAGQIFDAVREVHPEFRQMTIRRQDSPWLADEVRLQKPNRVWLDIWTNRETGAVQGATQNWGFRAVVRHIHVRMMSDLKIAYILVTSLSLVLLYQIISGLVAYRRFWKGLLRLPKSGSPGRAWWGAFHRVAALWALPVMILIALTSVLYFAESLGYSSKYPYSGGDASPREAILPEGFAGADMDRAVAAAQSALPGLEVTQIQVTNNVKKGLIIGGELTSYLTSPGANQASVDPVTFEVLGARRGEDFGIMGRIDQSQDLLHFGTFGGTISRFIWLIGGFLGTLVAFSGVMVYSNRVSAQVAGSHATRVWKGIFWPAKWATLAAFGVIFVLTILRVW